MTDIQNNEQPSGNSLSESDNNKGRLHGSGNPQLEAEANTGDISQVDQQEGNMNNGTLGGNFDEASDATENRTNKEK